MSYFRDILRKFRANLSFFFNTREVRYTKKEIKIVNKIYKIAFKINKNNNNKLNTHKIFSNKILNLILKKQLLNFLQVGFVQQMFFIHNRIFILFELLELFKDKKWSFWKKLISEDNIGNPVRFFIYPYSSGNKIHQIFHLKKFNDFSEINLREFDNVIEFGGGYGNMAKTFKKINPEINYIIFDTIEVNLLQYYYLRKSNIKVTIDCFKKKQVNLINNLKILRKTINKIKYRKKTLFIANWSLSEVPISFRNKINFLIKNIDYQIISYQDYFEKINNKKYFEKIMKNNLRKKRMSIIQNMRSKTNNYYLFSSLSLK